jgi:branched-chain amino acid transport system ATP-binding protein
MSPKDVPLLRVERLIKTFGGFQALSGTSFRIHEREVLGLVGPNGSGKTTCINVISGLYPPSGGRVVFEGEDVSGLAPHRLVHRGIARTFQVPKPFMTLTVRENVEVAATYGGGGRAADVDSVLASVELDGLSHKPASELNSVQQKMLDLARALATAPRLLCVDELAAGLSHSELDRVAAKLRALAEAGMGLLVVEHLMRFIDQVADRVIVMNSGKEIFEGSLADAVRDPQVVEVYFGAEHD